MASHASMAIACELYREAIHWAFSAIAPDAVPDDADLAAKVGGVEALERIRERLASASFVTFAELPESDARLEVARLGRLAHALLDRLESPEREIALRWRERLLRTVALPAAVAALLGLAGAAWAEHVDATRDLARGKPWRASSAWAQCDVERRMCGHAYGTRIFFHTNEEREPWVEFDLERSQRISGASIVNRSDCCVERAVPLVLEVSEDRERWTEVARRDRSFRRWAATFPPHRARFVRLRVLGRTYFHLEQVRIYP